MTTDRLYNLDTMSPETYREWVNSSYRILYLEGRIKDHKEALELPNLDGSVVAMITAWVEKDEKELAEQEAVYDAACKKSVESFGV